MKKYLPYLYCLIFLVPLIHNPWGGEGVYEASKQAWIWTVIGATLVACAIGLIVKNKIATSSSPITTWVFSLWICSFLLSTVLSIAPIESFWGTFSRMQGLVSHIFYGLHFLICVHLFKDKNVRTAFFNTTIFVGIILSAHAVYQWLTFVPQGEWSFFGRRSYSFMGNPTALGQFLLFPFWTTIYFAFEGEKRSERLAFAFGSILILAAMVATENRASFIGIGFALGVLWIHRYIKKPLMRGVLLIAGVVVLSIGIAVIAPHVRSLGTRSVLWSDSLATAADHQLIGSGPETYYQVIQRHLSPQLYLYERLTEIPDRAHNSFLDTLVTRGIFGVGIELFILFFIAGLFVQKKLKTPLAILCVITLSSYIVSLQFGFYGGAHAVFFAAMLAMLLHESGLLKTKIMSVTPFMRYGGITVLCTIAVFGISQSIRIIHSDTLAREGFHNYIIKPEVAYDYFLRSTKAAPQYADSYRRDIGLFRSEISTHPEYIVQLEKKLEALRRITNNSFYADVAYSQLAGELGDYEGAQKAYSDAASKAPNWPQLWMQWQNDAFINHDREGVKMTYQHLISIAPPYWKWASDGQAHTAEEMEQERIFRISNQGFYEALEKYRAVMKEN